MVISQNPEIGQIFRDEAKTTLSEGFPQNISSSIQPVLDLTPYFHKGIKIQSGASSTSASSGTIFTTSATKKTYIVGYQYHARKDATCDTASATAGIRATIDGKSQFFYIWYQAPLVLQELQSELMFDRPVLVDKNVAIQFAQSTFTVGTFLRSAVIYYYEEE